MNSSFYTLQVAGLTRQLPLCKINDQLSIAAFVIFGDVELTCRCAQALIPLLPPHDVMMVAEAKGIPLIHELARQMQVNHYIVARKAPKLYMQNPLSVTVKSITTQAQQTLYIGQNDAEMMRGKRVLLVDDVISTGESMHALEQLTLAAGGTVAGRAAILAEGDAANRTDIVYLENLPLFSNEL